MPLIYCCSARGLLLHRANGHRCNLNSTVSGKNFCTRTCLLPFYAAFCRIEPRPLRTRRNDPLTNYVCVYVYVFFLCVCVCVVVVMPQLFELFPLARIPAQQAVGARCPAQRQQHLEHKTHSDTLQATVERNVVLFRLEK